MGRSENMQFRALFKKEILVMMANRLTIFANIIIPIVIICISLLYSKTSDIYINLGCYGEVDDVALFKENLNLLTDDVTFSVFLYSDKQQMEEDFYKKSIDFFFVGNSENQFDVYYDDKNDKSLIAYRYFISLLQNLNSQNYSAEMMKQIMNMQTYIVSSTVVKEVDDGNAVDSFMWSGFIWILIYSNFSVAISQMQQERNTKTILYLRKSGAGILNIFFSKVLAGLVQFVLTISVYIGVTCKLGLLDYRFQIMQIVLLLLVAVMVLALGHFLGTIIKNSSILVILQMIIVFPLMIMNSLQTSSLEAVLKYNPVYCGAVLAQEVMSGKIKNCMNIMICAVTIIVCYFILNIYLKKSEPVKLCKIQ